MFDSIVTNLANYHVVLEPDENTPEWWAGAPSVLHDADGTFYLACRMREGYSPRGQRGYEVRILKSANGRQFTTIHRIRREEAGVPGFERPALVRVPESGAYRLYGCAGLEQGWAVLKFDDAESPAAFVPASARPVLSPGGPGKAFAHVAGYKDPVVFWARGQWHLFTIGYDRVERMYHFVSGDGTTWEPIGDNPFMENTGWHNYYTRPASVVPMAVGYLVVYEGSHITWPDPAYNIATGLAYSADLNSAVDLTPDAPLLKSTTPGAYHTWRYSHWLTVGNQVYAYFEAARSNNTNEIRLGIFEATFAR